MLKFFSLFLFTSAFILSCAKPPSLELQPKAEKTDTQQKQTGTCALFFKTTHLCVELIWDKIPTETEKGSLVLKYFVQEKPSKFVDPRQDVAVVVAMPKEDHQSAAVKITKVHEGEFSVENVILDRKGLWEIQLLLKDGSKVVDQVNKEITIK